MQKETKIPQIDLLLDYLDGILDSENASRIKSEIDDSDELKSIIEGINHMRNIEGYDDEQILSYIENLRSGFKPTESTSVSPAAQKFTWWKVAASIALLVGVWYFVELLFFKETADDFIDSQLSEVYESPTLFRDSVSNWSSIHSYYENKNYNAAIHELKSIESIDPHNMVASFYLGLCYLYDGNPDESIFYLQKVSKSNSRLSDRALWYLSLSYSSMENETEAKSALSKIVQNKSYKYSEAKELLNLLD